jgi:tRNA1Val (adenine37-N6)-methyltransferase
LSTAAAAAPAESPSGGVPTTTDTLLLAASVSVRPGSTVVELGCGAGGALLSAAGRNPGCHWIGLDIQLPLLLSAREASMQCSSPGRFQWVQCPVELVTSAFREGVADLVIANPPYAVEDSCRSSPVDPRRTARSARPMLLYRFLRGAAHLLRPGGGFVMVNRPGNLPSMLLGFGAFGIHPERLQPAGSPGSPAELVLLTGRKGSAGSLVILPQREAGELLDADPRC